MQAIYSALILACLGDNQLERAGELYQVALEAGLHPDVHAYNGLINAYGRMSEVCLQPYMHDSSCCELVLVAEGAVLVLDTLHARELL